MRKAGILLLVALGLSASMSSCAASAAALDAALDRQALSLRWMHQRGYLVPPAPGEDTAMDQIPDWDAVVYELQETNLSTAFAAAGAFLATGVSMGVTVLLAVTSWPRGTQPKQPESTGP